MDEGALRREDRVAARGWLRLGRAGGFGRDARGGVGAGVGLCVRQMRSARPEEEQRNTFACSASRSAALDLAGVPAKIEHRGQKEEGVYGHGVSDWNGVGGMRAHARKYR